MRALFSLIKLLMFEKTNMRFALGVWLGLSFSVAVILGTIGVMDGFDSAMRKALRRTNGDLYIYGRSGFFTFNNKDRLLAKENGAEVVSAYIQSQAFLVSKGISKGVAVRGIELDSFNNLSGLDIKIKDGEVSVGSELMNTLQLNIGDEIVLALAKGNQQISSLPLLKRFKIGGIVHHGIYEKDLRFIYMRKASLATILQVDNQVNAVAIKSQETLGDLSEHISYLQYRLEEVLGPRFRYIPYWYEYSSLLEAVKIQKITIALILQVIVIVSIFNVLAFVTFLNTIKAKDIFLYQALGMSRSHLLRAWLLVVAAFWFISCLTSIVLVHLFGYLLAHLSIFKLPGSVYNLARLEIILTEQDYLFVFLATLFWLIVIVYTALWKIRRQPILRGLRQEFS